MMKEERIDETLIETFPASDPPSWTLGVKKNEKTIWTIGHSTRSISLFMNMLKSAGVTLLVDVRTIPRSKFNPQYNREDLAAALIREKIAYLHMPGLGGLRKPQNQSVNQGWRNSFFRGYADYMQSPAFEEHVEGLSKIASEQKTAIMCAEAVPWRCHRSLIADVLTSRGWKVVNILGLNQESVHAINPMAKVLDGKVSYPSPT